MAFIDLQGQTFGAWTVLHKDDEKSKTAKEAYWVCECGLCGTISSVRGSALRQGRSTRCANHPNRGIDESGNKYNKLTVLKQMPSKNKRMIWLCRCDCGNTIEVNGTALRTGEVQSCGKCPGRASLGEEKIAEMLVSAEIPFETEYTFPDFKYETGQHPRFDFYIPTKHYLIEFDGIQHFKYDKSPSSWNTKENLIKTQQRDAIKNKYCFDNNIPLIRIPYNVKDLTIFDLIPETSRFLLKE